jgi:hypothetical protein
MLWWMIWFNVCTGQTAAHDSVKLWDLRKLKNFRTLNLYDSDTPTNSGVCYYGDTFPYVYVYAFMASGNILLAIVPMIFKLLWYPLVNLLPTT